MKILCVIDSLGSGGAQRQLVNLAKTLNKKGLEITVLVYNNDNFFSEEFVVNDIHIHHCISTNYFSRVIKTTRYIRQGNFEAVISFLDVPNFLNCVAAIGSRKWKVITSERSSQESILKSRRGHIFGWFQRYSDYIVCNSQNAKELWLKYYPQYSEKLKVIYNMVMLPEINSDYLPKKNGKVNIVIVASYQYLKNPIGLVKALSMLNSEEREKINVSWFGRKEVTTGNTKAFDETEELIAINNLKDVIQMNEATPDVANIMNQADIIGLFSRVEGLPNTICEGMMLGKPIIMTRVSDYSVLIDESNGFLCDWDNEASIKDTLIKAINLDDLTMKKLGNASKDKARNLFSAETIVNQWINLIEK